VVAAPIDPGDEIISSLKQSADSSCSSADHFGGTSKWNRPRTGHSSRPFKAGRSNVGACAKS
jgi:hypothetical protein